MASLNIASCQFEAHDGDKKYNLKRISTLTKIAKERAAQIVVFHECCVVGFSFLQSLTTLALLDLAEKIPSGPSIKKLEEIAMENDVVVMAGLLELDGEQIFNTYVTIGPQGFITKFRKLHAFIHPSITSGEDFVVVELFGWKIGFLICYDNNLPENVRICTLMGAKIIIMPHVTGCTASPGPGRGLVSKALWDNRMNNPEDLRAEFQGPKGRGWLMKWLPARAWENGVYAVFSNVIGVDYDTIKPGLSMIIDPFGEIVVESTALGDDVIVGAVTSDKLKLASGQRFIRARRPALYQRLLDKNEHAVTVPGWKFFQHQDSNS